MNRVASRPMSPGSDEQHHTSQLGSSGLITPIEAGSPTVPEISNDDNMPREHQLSHSEDNQILSDEETRQLTEDPCMMNMDQQAAHLALSQVS